MKIEIEKNKGMFRKYNVYAISLETKKYIHKVGFFNSVGETMFFLHPRGHFGKFWQIRFLWFAYGNILK